MSVYICVCDSHLAPSNVDLVFNNVKPKDWYRTEMGCVRLRDQIFGLMDQAGHHSWYPATILLRVD